MGRVVALARRPAPGVSPHSNGRVIWLTGLSGAGKTTLCRVIHERLIAHVPGVVVLDGDAVREALGSDLGYAEADRIRNIERMQRLARLLADQGLTVLVAALYSNPALLAWNREHLPQYREVYLRASVDALARRDPKGLYAAYREGRIGNMVGCDIPFTPPAAPDLVFDVDTFGDLRQMAVAVLDGIIR